MNTIVKNYRLAVKNTSFLLFVVIMAERVEDIKAFLVKRTFRTRKKSFIIMAY